MVKNIIELRLKNVRLSGGHKLPELQNDSAPDADEYLQPHHGYVRFQEDNERTVEKNSGIMIPKKINFNNDVFFPFICEVISITQLWLSLIYW
jgi:hypothetical protein